LAGVGYSPIPPMPLVHIKTYGCQMNERDTEQVSQMFTERGYTMTATDTDADVVLINTCSVRDQAEQKALACFSFSVWSRIVFCEAFSSSTSTMEKRSSSICFASLARMISSTYSTTR